MPVVWVHGIADRLCITDIVHSFLAFKERSFVLFWDGKTNLLLNQCLSKSILIDL